MRHRVNGIQLNVRDEGQENPTLLFLHYWGGSSRTWDQVVSELKTDFRCVAYDHRGWGESDKPETGYSIQELAYDAEALIQALELTRYVLIGHSMGGKVAQRLAAKRPEGLEALILVAPAPPTPMAVPEDVRKQMIHAYQNREAVEFLSKISSPLSRFRTRFESRSLKTRSRANWLLTMLGRRKACSKISRVRYPISPSPPSS